MKKILYLCVVMLIVGSTNSFGTPDSNGILKRMMNVDSLLSYLNHIYDDGNDGFLILHNEINSDHYKILKLDNNWKSVFDTKLYDSTMGLYNALSNYNFILNLTKDSGFTVCSNARLPTGYPMLSYCYKAEYSKSGDRIYSKIGNFDTSSTFLGSRQYVQKKSGMGVLEFGNDYQAGYPQVAFFDSQCEKKWERRFSLPDDSINGVNYYINKAIELRNGEFVAFGIWQKGFSYDTTNRYFMIRTDSEGNVLKYRQLKNYFINKYIQHIGFIYENSDSTLTFIGCMSEPDGWKNNIPVFITTDTDFNVKQIKTYSFGNEGISLYSSKRTNDAGFAISGCVGNLTSTGSLFDAYFMKLDSVGNKQWDYRWNNPEQYDIFNDFVETKGGVFTLVGVKNIGFGTGTGIIMEISPPKTVGVQESTENVSECLSISPNPVSDVLNIQLPSASFGSAQVKIYSQNGEEVMVRNVAIENGETSFSLDKLGSLSSGVYLVSVNINGTFYRQKFVKM